MDSARRPDRDDYRSAASRRAMLEDCNRQAARERELLDAESERLRGCEWVTVDHRGRSMEDMHGA